jgi:hypothetical protein
VRRREALAEAIDLVHDRYQSDLEQIGQTDARPLRPSMID